MPTKKPRITITLDAEQHEVLSRVSRQQRRSMSSLVSELVGAVVPSLRRVSTLLDRASSANGQVVSGLVAGVERAEALVTELTGPSMRGMELFARARDRALLEEVKEGALARRLHGAGGPAKRGAPRRAGRSGQGRTPVPVTRGSGTRKRGQRGGRGR